MGKSRDTSTAAADIDANTADIDANATAITALDSAKVENAGNVTAIRKLTQAEYDALTPDATTVYIIVG